MSFEAHIFSHTKKIKIINKQIDSKKSMKFAVYVLTVKFGVDIICL